MPKREKTAMDELMFAGSVPRLLLRLALPIYVSALFWILYTLTDIYWISRIDPEDPTIVAGVSLIVPIYLLAFALSNGLLAGVKTLVARAIGANREEPLRQAASAGCKLAAVAALAFIVPGYVFSREIVGILGATGAVSVHARTFLLWLLPAPALLFAFSVLNGIAQGEGRMTCVMRATGLGVALNMILDPLLILGAGWGVAGAAAATCVSQAAALLCLALSFARGQWRTPLRIRLRESQRAVMARILRIGLPQGMSELLVVPYLLILNGIVIRLDPLAMTAFGLCARVDQVLLLSVAAVSSAVLTAVAQNASRGNRERVRDIQRAAIRIGMPAVLLQALVLFAAAPWIYRLLSDVEGVVAYAVAQTRIVNLFYVFAVPTLVFHSYFLAIGRPGPALWIQFVKMFLVSVPTAALLIGVFDFDMRGVWLGIVAGEIVAPIIGAAWSRRRPPLPETMLREPGAEPTPA